MLSIQGSLFQLRRESILAHEGYFGTEQANTLGATIQRPRYVAGQADIHPEMHLPSVSGHTGQLLQVVELFSENLFLLQQEFVLGEALCAGASVDVAVVAINDQASAF